MTTSLFNATSSLVLGAFLLTSCGEEKVSAESPAPPSGEIASLTKTVASLEWELSRERQLRHSDQKAHLSTLNDLKALVLELGRRKPEPRFVIQAPTPAPPVLEKQPIISSKVRDAARQEAIGEKHASFTTASGVKYRDLTLIKVTDITVRHSSGIARIPFADLPEEWRERFHFDAQRASLAVEKERNSRQKYEQAIAKYEHRAERQQLRDLQTELKQMEETLKSERARSIAALNAARAANEPPQAQAPPPKPVTVASQPPTIIETVYVEESEKCPPPPPRPVIVHRPKPPRPLPICPPNLPLPVKPPPPKISPGSHTGLLTRPASKPSRLYKRSK